MKGAYVTIPKLRPRFERPQIEERILGLKLGRIKNDKGMCIKE